VLSSWDATFAWFMPITCLKVHYALICGHASAVLLEESARARELVIGPDNGSWVSRLFEGEVCRLVVTGTKCPVVVVPEHSASLGGQKEVVLTAADEPPAEGPIRYASDEVGSSDGRRTAAILMQLGFDVALAWPDGRPRHDHDRYSRAAEAIGLRIVDREFATALPGSNPQIGELTEERFRTEPLPVGGDIDREFTVGCRNGDEH